MHFLCCLKESVIHVLLMKYKRNYKNSVTSKYDIEASFHSLAKVPRKGYGIIICNGRCYANFKRCVIYKPWDWLGCLRRLNRCLRYCCIRHRGKKGDEVEEQDTESSKHNWKILLVEIISRNKTQRFHFFKSKEVNHYLMQARTYFFYKVQKHKT